jgi:GPH family glycoside/pentoside/hexuronide:cation symporter
VWAIEGLVHVFTGSMTADLCDIDELATGRRREGMYMSLLPLVIKLSGALGMFFWGLLLSWSGFVGGQMTQSPEVIQRLFIAMAVPTCVGALTGVIILLKYDVTESTIRDVRLALDARRAGLSTGQEDRT